MHYSEITHEILTGGQDENLSRIQLALRERQNLLRLRKANENIAKLQVGTKVRMGTDLRPQYLRNRTGVVESFRNTRMVVKLDCGPIGKFRSGKVVTPIDAVTVLAS